MKPLLPLLLAILLASCTQSEKTGYIDINKVYGEINITKKYNAYLASLENELASKIAAERALIQDQKNNILTADKPSQSDLKKAFELTNVMDSIEQHYSKLFQDSTEKYNLLVEKTVNDLVYKYGQVKSYTYLYSPATSNSFMYADSTLDVTQKVVKFINQETD